MLTVDALYTNAAPLRSSGLTFITDDDAKMLKTATHFYIASRAQ